MSRSLLVLHRFLKIFTHAISVECSYNNTSCFFGLGFANNADYWASPYEMEDFRSEVERLRKDLEPLYHQLHAYVRRKLKGIYDRKQFPASGHIPAHILGSLFGDLSLVQFLNN